MTETQSEASARMPSADTEPAQPPRFSLYRRLGRWGRMFLDTARRRFISHGRGIYLGRNVHVKKGAVVVGHYTYIGNECHLMSRLTIGNWVMFASRVSVVGGDHVFDAVGVPSIWAGRDTNQEAVVEDDVWVGHGATIMHGVRIGEGAIVAAGSVVTKDVEPYTIVAGVPAKFLRRRFEAADEARHRECLENLRQRYASS